MKLYFGTLYANHMNNAGYVFRSFITAAPNLREARCNFYEALDTYLPIHQGYFNRDIEVNEASQEILNAIK